MTILADPPELSEHHRPQQAAGAGTVQLSTPAGAAWERLEPVFAEIRAAAAEREQAGQLDHSAVSALKRAGFTTLRVPQEHGGAGLGFEEASWFLVALG